MLVSFYLIGLHGPPCFDLSWAKTMKFDGDVFCLSYFIWFWYGFHFASFGWIEGSGRRSSGLCRAHNCGLGVKKDCYCSYGSNSGLVTQLCCWPCNGAPCLPVWLGDRSTYFHISIFPYSAECSRCSVSWCGEFFVLGLLLQQQRYSYARFLQACPLRSNWPRLNCDCIVTKTWNGSLWIRCLMDFGPSWCGLQGFLLRWILSTFPPNRKACTLAQLQFLWLQIACCVVTWNNEF